MVMTMTASLS